MDNNIDNINNESFVGLPKTNVGAEPQRAAVPPLFENGAAFPRNRIKTNTFDKIAVLLNFVLTFLFIKSVLFADRSNWKTTASYLGIFALATAFIAVKQKIFNVRAVLIGVLCVAASASFALRENPYAIKFWVIIMLMYLSGSYCIALTNSNRHSRNSYFFLLDVLKTEVLLPLKHFFLPYAAMHNTRKEKNWAKGKAQKKLDKKYIAVIIGVICALPVLLIVVPLLLKSDAAFESVAGSFFEKLGDYLGNLNSSFSKIPAWFDENLFFIIPAVFVAPYIFSVMFSFRYSVSNEENKNTGSRYAKLRFGSPALFAGFLGVICLVYVIYLLSQTAYFFSAFGGKLPDGTDISLAQYARRGFFELAGVAGMNLALIAVTVLFSRRNNGDFNVIIKAFDLFLCAFNILLSAISMSKIVLYMNEMGLTHKRIYVFLVDIVMIVTFLCVIIRLLNKKFPYMQVITATACILLTALSLVGVDGIIANYNAEKYLKNEISGDDIYEVLDSDTIAAFESCLKIAENGGDFQESPLVGSALTAVHNRALVFSDGKFKLCDDYGDGFGYFFNLDARKAVKLANEHTETAQKAFKYDDIFQDNDEEVEDTYVSKFYVFNNTFASISSISLTLYDKNDDAVETSVVSNADGSALKKGDVFNFEFKNKKVTGGEYHSLDIVVTDTDGRKYSGQFDEEYFEDETHINLVSSADCILAIHNEYNRVETLS